MNSLLKSLNDIAKEMDAIGQEIYSGLKGDMENDLQFMCKLFSKRQLSQLRSLVLLEGRDDTILIARSMFEGALYLSYATKDEAMSRRWRLFSCVTDIQRIDSSGDPVPEDLRMLLENLKPEVDKLFKKEDGEYHRNWHGDKSINKISKLVDNQYQYLYQTYYSPMSEYHHWATAAFGKRYKLDDNRIITIDNDQVKMELADALCMALSSIFSTLKIASKILDGEKDCLNKIEILAARIKDLDGTTTREINITINSSRPTKAGG